MAERTDAGLRVVVIGAGISGILLGIKLRERGITDFVILEKGATLGGTWRDNVYPGAACDVAAHSYVYSFAPNPWWTSRYAKGPAIQRYYADCARRFGVLPHVRYDQEVVSVTWIDDAWQLRTCSGEIFAADVVIAACGRLHHPVLPEIPGRERFAGAAFHTARWDKDVDLRGKRLALIGTGSTATQIVAALADQVGALKLFQRTPQWVFPVADTPIPLWQRLAYKLSPKRARSYYRQLREMTEARGRAATGDASARAARDQQCFDALATVRDPALRAKLTPDYEVGCKRLVMSGTFYEAVQKPTVEVVTDAIDHIDEHGIVTRDGTHHAIDVLVFATGFDAHAYLRPMAVTGENGVTLEQVWDEVPLTYRSMTIPHMPNFFLINGPYSPGGTASVVGIVEAQVDYVLRLIDRVGQKGVAIVPREDAARDWLESVRARARASVWGTGGCQSWYLDKTGTPSIDPSPLSDLEAQLATIEEGAFEVRPRARAALDAAA